MPELNSEQIGLQMHAWIAELYPICRSITGDGLRQTLARIREQIPIATFEVPTGTTVFDWTVPKEWNVRDAYVANSRGERVIDFRKSNLHLLNYSVPVRQTVSLSELKRHLYTIPEHPDWTPYRTSYYKENWGFCLSHNQLEALTEDRYEVCVDTTLENGHLSYGEYYLPGASTDEILFSCHVCHPSLCNDNLSGVAVAVNLAKRLAEWPNRRHSIRFLFIPGTIGAITWLAMNREHAARIRHGLVLTGLGDSGAFHYKKSRRGDAAIDRAAAHVLKHCGEAAGILDFSPYGYDERQYCSPGFNLPVGCLMRSVHGTFPEYHTSADNLDFVKPDKLAEALQVCLSIVEVLESDQTYANQIPFCEPQLGKRGLYGSTGGQSPAVANMARLWLMSFSDGRHSLLDIAERAGVPFSIIREAARELQSHNLLSESPRPEMES
jgi:aminopeptidase-like protein